MSCLSSGVADVQGQAGLVDHEHISPCNVDQDSGVWRSCFRQEQVQQRTTKFVPLMRLSESIIEKIVDVPVFDQILHVAVPQMLTELSRWRGRFHRNECNMPMSILWMGCFFKLWRKMWWCSRLSLTDTYCNVTLSSASVTMTKCGSDGHATRVCVACIATASNS